MLRVLTYHRIVARDDESTTPGIASATVERFAAHVRFLARDFDPVALDDVIRAVLDRAPLPRRAILVTFDDAYRDFASAAWPILKRHTVPATVFVPTAYVGRTGPVFWWDRLYASLMQAERDTLHLPGEILPLGTRGERLAAFRNIRNRIKGLTHAEAMQLVDAACSEAGEPAEQPEASVLSWDDLRALAHDGVALASHTHTHPLLNRVSRQRVREEVATSLQALERELGATPPVLSYPNGAHDDAAVDELRRSGIEVAFTQLPGLNDPARVDPLRLCRINVTRRTSLPLLKLRLQRWFAPIERWRKRKRIRAYQSPLPSVSGAEI